MSVRCARWPWIIEAAGDQVTESQNRRSPRAWTCGWRPERLNHLSEMPFWCPDHFAYLLSVPPAPTLIPQVIQRSAHGGVIDLAITTRYFAAHKSRIEQAGSSTDQPDHICDFASAVDIEFPVGVLQVLLNGPTRYSQLIGNVVGGITTTDHHDDQLLTRGQFEQ